METIIEIDDYNRYPIVRTILNNFNRLLKLGRLLRQLKE